MARIAAQVKGASGARQLRNSEVVWRVVFGRRGGERSPHGIGRLGVSGGAEGFFRGFHPTRWQGQKEGRSCVTFMDASCIHR